MKQSVVIGMLLTLLQFQLDAQESLHALRYNESLIEDSKGKTEQAVARDINRKPFIYLVDTLPLPFIDDFSTNQLKKFDAVKSGDNITLKILNDFSVNGETPIRLEMMSEPTYTKVKKTNGDIENEENPTLYIIIYDSIGNEVGFDTGWTNILTIFDQSQGIVSFDTLQPDKIYINTFDTLYLVDDDESLWITPGNEPNRGGAYINNNFSRDPITQGVATFDGTDAVGVPYDIGGATTHGGADTLESKPIALDPEMQNVFLTFFYQAGGLGNMPDEEDSLVLEFFDVASESWRHAWSTQGNLPDREWSEQVWIKIDQPKYLLPGFQFRFRNYATLSAAFDHWNIDYVRLDSDRDSVGEDTIYDVSLMKPMSSFVAPYSTIPYDHYKGAPYEYQSDTVKTTVKNLSSDSIRLDPLGYEIRNESGTLVNSFLNADANLPSFTTRNYNFILSDTAKEFPLYPEKTHVFDVITYFGATGSNTLRINDTIKTQQVFANHFAYDDGSAEAAYGLTGAGVALAMGYETHIQDTIRAIHFNFPLTIEDNVSDLSFQIVVWEKLDESPIYESTYTSSPVTTRANEFVRYTLEEPVIVEGEFYIGFRQLQADKIYIGFDMNQINNNRLFYQIGAEWLPSTFPGSLMMRPDFGDDYTMGTNFNAGFNPEAFDIQLFPNPASDYVQWHTTTHIVSIKICDVQGRALRKVDLPQGRISLDGLPAGPYLLIMTNEAGESTTKKLLKQ